LLGDEVVRLQPQLLRHCYTSTLQQLLILFISLYWNYCSVQHMV